MREWDESRRRNAAVYEHTRISEEIAEQTRDNAKSMGNTGYLLFIVAVIFFMPFAESCIELYNTLAGYLHGIAGMLGF
ncbi:hypothetical protein OE766_24940 [Pararhizobium sp. YC-54]|uniref:hypothetical protein n=1 Tax=Pararhizobium sp. YC-54 TaxID=2986920 RepID=UPI0021F7B369|nr:hypothetical protein [Pararhizobium sp. YC-54]MCW0001472.1 hypothetical protein [Pararhizobium sp. YC-54]